MTRRVFKQNLPGHADNVGLHSFPGETPGKALRKEWGKDLFTAIIVNVHSELMTMDVLSKENNVVLTDIPVTSPYVGPSGFMGVCPEPGSKVVLYRGVSGGIYPLAYLIPEPEFALEYMLLEKFPKDLSDPILELNRQAPAKFRKLRPGEALFASSMGAELLLDHNIELEDSSGNGLRIRSGDGSFISTSQQNYMFANGVWRSAGPIQRNSLEYEILGLDLGGYEAQEINHSDGTRCVYIGGYAYKGRVYNEYRIEVEDSNFLGKQINDVNEGYNDTVRFPKVTHVMGNMVGNDVNDPGTYGKFLTPVFLRGARGEGHLGFEALTPNGDGDALGSRGVSWAYHTDKKGFFGQDKEGCLHAYLGEDKLGTPGLSMAIVGQGGRREEWGIIRQGGLSWDLYCRGAISWVIGKGQENPSNGFIPRSAEYRYIGGTYTEHGYDPEYDTRTLRTLSGSRLPLFKLTDYKRVERVAGKSREEIRGDSEIQIGGSLVKQIESELDVSVGGAMSESSMGDRTINTLGAFSVNATTEIKVQAQQRSETFVKGNDERLLLLGNAVTDVYVGNIEDKVKLGSLKRETLVGNIDDKIAAGNHSVSVGVGSYNLSVASGSISQTTGVGAFTVGGTSVIMNATAAVNINAPFVGIGNPVTRSGVITMLSHRDYVTGAPLIPSLTVLAGL